MITINEDTLKKLDLYHVCEYEKRIRTGDIDSINNERFLKRKKRTRIATEINIIKGKYYFYTKKINKRRGLLYMINSKYIGGTVKLKKLCMIGVDTGIVAIVDSNNDLKDYFYEKIKIPRKDSLGVYIESGYGDGYYPLYVALKNEKVYALLYIFIESD